MHKSHHFRFSRTSGFALIIALLLMAFMVLLLIALATTTQVQLQAGTAEASRNQARQNALLALHLAVGRLSELAQDDTVTTASAALFADRPQGAPAGTGVPEVVNPANLNWIGVWDASQTGWSPANPDARRFKGWLISTPDADQLAAVASPPPEHSTTLLKSTDSDGISADVIVPRVQWESNGRLNSYAFWVSDEALKASLALYDPWFPRSSGGTVAAQLERTVSQKNNLNALAALEKGVFTDATWAEQIARTLDWYSLNHVQASGLAGAWGQALKQHRHDLTFNAQGLLTNPRKGGWKKDLTRAFNSDEGSLTNAFFEENFAGKRIFDQEDFASYNNTGKHFYGPRWESLRSFHEHWREADIQNSRRLDFRNLMPMVRTYPFGESNAAAYINSTADTTHPRLRNMLPGTFTQVSAHYRREDLLDYLGSYAKKDEPITIANKTIFEILNSPIAPVVTSADVVFTLSSYPDPEAADPENPGYYLEFSYMPVIHLWNPYNVPIQLKHSSGMHYRFSNSPSFALKDSGGNTIPITLHTRDYSAGAPSDAYKTGKLEQFTLRDLFGANEIAIQLSKDIELNPGEIRVFSLERPELVRLREVKVYDDDGVDTGQTRNIAYYTTNSLTNGWNSGAGHVFRGKDTFDTEGAPYPAGTTIFIEVDVPHGSIANSTDRHTPTHARISATEERWLYFNEYIYYNKKEPIGRPEFTRDLTIGPNASVDVAISKTYVRPSAQAPEDAKGDKILGQHNPAAIFRGYQSGRRISNPSMGLEIIEPQGTAYSPDVDGNSPLRGYWGGSLQADSGRGKTNVILYDVPRAPLTSLGQLQNANISLHDWQPAYAIGNSFAPASSIMPQTAIVSYVNDRTHIDYSWMLNHNLWDEYFFSAITEGRQIANGSGGILLDETYLLEDNPLPNNRYRLNLLKDDLDDLRSFQTGASQLLVQGAFNVNSTSVQAWKMILSSLGNQSFTYTDEQGASHSATPLNPFYRHGTPLRDPASGGSNNWSAGWVNLTNAQIDALAQQIVNEVKRRGPFMGLADFVNRRLDNSDSGKTGTLQAAIDNSAINGSLEPLAPGAVSQADVLAAIAPFLSTRGDTFLVRAYGSVAAPGDNTPEAETWVEALVQRTPHPEDHTQRRFVIHSLRWLTEDEL